MDQAMFKGIADKVAKEVEDKMRTGMLSQDGEPGSDSGDFMQSEMGREIYKTVADEIAQSVAKSFVPTEIAKSMGPQFMNKSTSGSCQSRDSMDTEAESESAGEKKILKNFEAEVDGLLSMLEGRIDTILELCEEGDLSHEAASKKFKRTRKEFGESLKELRKRKNWKLDFVNGS
jgi:hypothetical protein